MHSILIVRIDKVAEIDECSGRFFPRLKLFLGTRPPEQQETKLNKTNQIFIFLLPLDFMHPDTWLVV